MGKEAKTSSSASSSGSSSAPSPFQDWARACLPDCFAAAGLAGGCAFARLLLSKTGSPSTPVQYLVAGSSTLILTGVSIRLGEKLGKTLGDAFFKPHTAAVDDAEQGEGGTASLLKEGVPGLVGGTPLVRIASLSTLTGCEILGKAEYLNPGGSSKDRVALQVILDAEKDGLICPGGTLVEGTSGSTGISLAALARAFGYKCHVVMPDDQAEEKATMLKMLGATVQMVRPVSIVNEGHYVNVARKVAHNMALGEGEGESSNASSSSAASTTNDRSHAPRALFCNQFECESNYRAHFLHTGPEIWTQTGGRIDAFVMGAGTGGTLAGVGAYLRSKRIDIGVYLADPPGSSLFNKVMYGVAYASQQAERGLRRHRQDTIIEGVGLDRVTANFERALPHLNSAFTVTDKEAVEMSRFLLRNDGLFIGSSTAMNCVAAVKLARFFGTSSGKTIVTLLCDSGTRHVSRFWNEEFIASIGLTPEGTGNDLSFVA